MRFRKSNRTARVVLGSALFLAALTGTVPAQDPSKWPDPDEAGKLAQRCDCDRAKKQLQNYLKEKEDARDTWETVKAQTEGPIALSEDWARRRFGELHQFKLNDELFGCHMHDLGVVAQSFGGFFDCESKIRISKRFAQCVCREIIPTEVVHERKHCEVNRRPSSWWDATMNPARGKANSEFEAHKEHVKSLEEELKRLKEKCPDLSLSIGQIRIIRRVPVARAEKRVRQYVEETQIPPPPPPPSPPPTEPPTPEATPQPAPMAYCAAPWSPTQVYMAGTPASVNGKNYMAVRKTQGQNPETNNGPPGSNQPWLKLVVDCAP